MAAVAQMDRYESYLSRCGIRYPQSRPRVSHSELSLLSACIRLCQLREVHHSLQQRSNRRVTCLLHIISDVTRVRHAQGTINTLSILRAFIACAAAVQTAVLVLFGPACLGHYRPLQRRSASDKRSVRCRPIKQRQNLPQLLIKIYLR